MSEKNIEKLDYFSLNWWQAFQQTWNQQKAISHKLAGLGAVIFQFSDIEGLSVCLNWDKKGQIIGLELADKIADNLPIFSATAEVWKKFINKEIGAARAVMGGMIKYQGPFGVLLKYGIHFDLLADVAQKINIS